MYEDKPLIEILTLFYETMEEVGYSKTAIGDARCVGSALLSFAPIGQIGCPESLIQRFLFDCYNISTPVYYGDKLSSTDYNRLRGCDKLSAFCRGEDFVPSLVKRKELPLSKNLEDTLNRFYTDSISSGKYSKTSIASHKKLLRSFLYFLNGIGITECSNISEKNLQDWLGSLNVKPVTIKGYCSTISKFVKYLYETEVISKDISIALPKIRLWRLAAIPSVWNKEDLEKLLDSVDRGSPIGKRDYAMLILAAKLGLRASDIKHLKFENLKWSSQKSKSELVITQFKTGEPLHLPILPEIGDVLIDYIKNGRPKSEYPNIFITHNFPFTPFGDGTTLSCIINRYAKRANIRFSTDQKHGIHSLRHTFASNLVNHGVGVETAAGLMGHANTQTLHIYAKSDIETLRKCVLIPSEVIPVEKAR